MAARNMVAKILIFTILVNMSAGIIMMAVVDTAGNPVFSEADKRGYEIDDMGGDFAAGMEEDIRPQGTLEDAADQVYRVLDMLSLGFITRFFEMARQFMYGSIDILEAMVGPMLQSDLRQMLFGSTTTENNFGLLHTILSIGYILMGIFIYTGKDVVGGVV